MSEQQYAGFWIRVVASIIDTIFLLIVLLAIVFALYSAGLITDNPDDLGMAGIFLNYIIPLILVLIFWHYKSATPGKIITHISIVDAETGGKPSSRQFIIRYIAYYISAIPLLLGFIWVGFDQRKQGWHDKLAKTVVIKTNPN
ncbi:MAG: putative RDD family membrane protein YckC [Pseudomonadales bacterium]|jgi:uncharacterized RDD family membrane protein YckC